MSRHDELPTDRRMRALRRRGAFVCRCDYPRPQWLALWQCSQCADCGKPIFEQLSLFDENGDPT